MYTSLLILAHMYTLRLVFSIMRNEYNSLFRRICGANVKYVRCLMRGYFAKVISEEKKRNFCRDKFYERSVLDHKTI